MANSHPSPRPSKRGNPEDVMAEPVLTPPAGGAKITITNGKLNVPDLPEGDVLTWDKQARR